MNYQEEKLMNGKGRLARIIAVFMISKNRQIGHFIEKRMFDLVLSNKSGPMGRSTTIVGGQVTDIQDKGGIFPFGLLVNRVTDQ